MMSFSKADVHLDVQKEVDRIVKKLKNDIAHNLKKRGAVLGISGGIDSSVVLAVCVEAFGPKKVLGLMMPEHDSNPESLELATALANRFGIEYIVEDMSAALAGYKCYERRDEPIKRVFPD